MEWFKVEIGIFPKGKFVLCHCPGWNNSGYQVAYHNGEKFVYDEQLNDTFDSFVIAWQLILEYE